MCTHSLSGQEATRIVLKKLDSKAYAPADVQSERNSGARGNSLAFAMIQVDVFVAGGMPTAQS